jgi:hypothetical protein
MASLKHIHIIGSSPRSGTTLLAEAMATCFDIDAHCPHEESIATPPPVRSGTYLSKQPGELLAVRLPLAVDRDLRVLCMIRDPRDVCISRHGSAPDRYWCSMRYWHLFLRHLSWLERHPRVLCIRYEDLVDDPDAVQDRIIDFLPELPAQHRFSHYHKVACPSDVAMKALRSVRPIQSASVGGWRKDPQRIKHQIAIHGSISNSLIRLGYEMDNSWERALMGIDECALRTRLPETFEWKFLIGRRWRGVVAAVRSFTRRIMFAWIRSVAIRHHRSGSAITR